MYLGQQSLVVKSKMWHSYSTRTVRTYVDVRRWTGTYSTGTCITVYNIIYTLPFVRVCELHRISSYVPTLLYGGG